MLYSYYLGLDLGQARDYTALCVLEEPVWIPPEELESPGWAWELNIKQSGWVSPADLLPGQLENALAINYEQGRPHDPPLSVRHLVALPAGHAVPEGRRARGVPHRLANA